ncbi:MAG: HAMP domain-containing protein, partial [Candidatus Methanospirareceae archaeon]
MSEVVKNMEIDVEATTPTTNDRDMNRLTKAQLQAELKRKERELDELEETVKQLFKNIPLPMHLMYVDKERRIRYVSEELAKYRGFEGAKQLIGREITELFPGSGGKAINAVIDTGKPIDHAEMHLGKKGEGKDVKVPILASCRPIYDTQGNITGAIPAFTEITEQKEQQEYLERNAKNIRAAMMEIANGNLEIELEKEREDEIGEIIDNVHAVAESVNGIVEEAKLLTDAASEGKLDIRGD